MCWNWCWWNTTVFALSVFWVVVLASSFATPSGKFLNKIAENCTMKVPTRTGNKLKIGITVCKVAQTRYPCEGSACFGSTASLQRNRPFASSHSRGTKPPYWRARDAPGEDKQRTNHAKWSELFAFSVPVRLLFSSMAVLYPVNGKLQRACCHTIESALANIFQNVSLKRDYVVFYLSRTQLVQWLSTVEQQWQILPLFLRKLVLSSFLYLKYGTAPMHSFLSLYFSYIPLRARCIVTRYQTKVISGGLYAGGIASCVGGGGGAYYIQGRLTHSFIHYNEAA